MKRVIIPGPPGTGKTYHLTNHYLRKEIEEYKVFLQSLTNTLDASKDSDLLNIRDEMLGQLNQFTYLLTLN